MADANFHGGGDVAGQAQRGTTTVRDVRDRRARGTPGCSVAAEVKRLIPPRLCKRQSTITRGSLNCFRRERRRRRDPRAHRNAVPAHGCGGVELWIPDPQALAATVGVPFAADRSSQSSRRSESLLGVGIRGLRERVEQRVGRQTVRTSWLSLLLHCEWNCAARGGGGSVAIRHYSTKDG